MLIVLSHFRYPSDEIEVKAAKDAGVELYIHRSEAGARTPLPMEVRQRADAMIHYPANVLVDGTPDDYPKLRALMRSGVGFDNIDVSLWGGRGIPVMNIPDYGTSEVADHAIGLLLSLARGTSVYHEAIRNDPVAGWKSNAAPLVRRLRNETFGVIGLGRIGLAAATRARGFGMQIACYDPYLPRGMEIAVGAKRCETLDELMSISDVVSVHAPGSDETTNMVNAQSLSKAKKNLILINTARGSLVDMDAVHDALKAGAIAGAALDVLHTEPADRNHPLVAAFINREPWTMGRLTFSPHAAFYSPDATFDMRVKGLSGMIRYLNSGDLDYCVNKHVLRRNS